MSERPKRTASDVRISVAKSLTAIENLALDLHAQALNDPNSRDFPGGTALHMLGPAVPLQDWERQYEGREQSERWDTNGTDRWAKQPRLNPAIDQGDDTEQPLNVLATWTRMIREDRDQPTSLTPTISRECDYLRGALDWCCRVDEYGEPEWPLCFDLADELRVLVRRMEDVLRSGWRPDLSKAKCNRCDARPRLHRVWTTEQASDGWRCPNCKVPFTEGEAARALGQMLHADGSDKFVWVNDARDVAGIDRRTWHSWRERLKMRTVCDIKTRRIEVWWPDVRDLVREHRLRKAQLAAKKQAKAS